MLVLLKILTPYNRMDNFYFFIDNIKIKKDKKPKEYKK
jgi:hypothetical protein